jgi:predicted permease
MSGRELWLSWSCARLNPWAAARLRPGAPHRANQRRPAAVELRHALSRAAQAGTGRFHPLALGHVSENNRKAKFYELTKAGHRQLKKAAAEWEQTTNILARFLTPAALAISHQRRFTFTGTGDAERVLGDYVSSDFFSILGVKPVLGRLFAPGEDEIGRSPLVLISAGFWARKFASRPDILGQTIALDGRNFTIIGVLPEDFDLAVGNFRAGDLYVPIGQWQTPALNNRFAGLGLHGIARLKPGITLAQAQADMNGVTDHLALAFPQADHGVHASIVSLRQSVVGSVEPLLLVLLGAVGFVLLIACMNVANLLLARSSARTQEFAIRSALGAGRIRIVRQMLTESTILALAGGALGLLLASWGTHAIVKLVPVALPRASHIHLSVPVLCFTFAVSLGVGILFGLLPAWKVSRQKLQDTLKEGSRSVSGTRHRTRDLLVVFEIAMALVLLVGAGLMIRSMIALSRVDPGFDPKRCHHFQSRRAAIHVHSIA